MSWYAMIMRNPGSNKKEGTDSTFRTATSANTPNSTSCGTSTLARRVPVLEGHDRATSNTMGYLPGCSRPGVRRLISNAAEPYGGMLPPSDESTAVKTGLRLLMRPTERGRSSLFVTITNTFPGCFSVIVSVLELSLTSATWSGAS